MKMSFVTRLCCFIFIVGACSPDDASKSKRLLINDPEFVLKELNSMKSEITDLKSKLATAQTEIASLNAKQATDQTEITDFKSKIATVSASNKILQDSVAILQNGKDGSVYTRWGRKKCAGNMTELVYAGFGAGSLYNKTGGGANPLCMPTDPLWGHYNDSATTYGASLYGMEYENLEFVSNVHNENAPCAVCRAKATTVLMIPGRNKCYPGWNMEYNGYLVSGWDVYKASTHFICLDASPEVLIAGHNNEDGSILFSVEGICGSLPCPPYVNHRELTCVVCSK